MTTLKTILRLPAFYTALLALVHTVIAAAWPTFPSSIIVAGDALVLVVAGVFTSQQVMAERAQSRSVKPQTGIRNK